MKSQNQIKNSRSRHGNSNNLIKYVSSDKNYKSNQQSSRDLVFDRLTKVDLNQKKEKENLIKMEKELKEIYEFKSYFNP